MRYGIVALLIIAGVCPVWGNGMTPMDFAKGIVLECPEDASVYRFVLPEHVYEGLTRSDFGDLRVFNGNGEEVPFCLKRPEDGRVRKTPRPPVPVVLFPVYGTDRETKTGSGVNVHIETNDTGAVIDVKTNGQDGITGQDRPVSFYLLDLSQVENKPEQLRFDWNRLGKDSMARIRIFESQDLDHWTLLVRSTVLADFQLGANHLRQDTVSLPSYRSDYLKVEMMEDQEGFSITTVSGLYTPIQVEHDTSWHFTKVMGVLSPDTPADYLFTLPFYLPVERVRVLFPQKNTLIRASIKSRMNDKAPWTLRYRGMLYNMTLNGVEFERIQMDCPGQADLFWGLSVDSGEGGIGKGMLEMDMGWIPHTLLFVARGKGPFTLAYGSGKAGPLPNHIDPLLRDLRREQEKFLVKEARLKSTIELGGRKQLEKPREPIPWRRMVLWGILVAGVGLCAAMAFSLYKQMKTAQQPK